MLSVLLAGLVAIPVGAIVAIPAIRLTGVFLALATLGFGILLQQMFYTQSWMFGPDDEWRGRARARIWVRSAPIRASTT